VQVCLNKKKYSWIIKKWLRKSSICRGNSRVETVTETGFLCIEIGSEQLGAKVARKECKDMSCGEVIPFLSGG